MINLPACLLGCCTSVHTDSWKLLEHGIMASWPVAAVLHTLQPGSLVSLNPVACTQRILASLDHAPTFHCPAQPSTSQQHAA